MCLGKRKLVVRRDDRAVRGRLDEIDEAASSPPVYALCKWLTGRCEGTFTHNVRIDSIRDFDVDNVSSEESYLVEWRQPPKPAGGWHVYDALVFDTSDDLDYLLQKKRQLEATQLHDNSNIDGASNKSVEIDKLVEQRVNAALSARRASSPSMKEQEEAALEKRSMVKIGHQLLVPEGVYFEAKASRSPTYTTMLLTRAAFSTRKPSSSTYAGQKRTLGDGVQDHELEFYCLLAAFVYKKFGNLLQSTFSAAVNACVGQRAQRVKKVQLVNDSSDEEEL
ncbi:hypothetical protein ONE63_011099 [Megalurothrips usitatus]|uniref:Uncharacterized protein n=1 Tax=Megalurothrips usitatus TaxID=439358 RepID=A0AAV7XII4_9NEOP|nr:hypothetical protein ONE63_011099 [Megalurothrips usitatus]